MQAQPKRVGIVARMGTCRLQCPKKKVHAVEELTTSGQPGHHHGWRNWKLLLRLWQVRRSVLVPSVREGEFVDIDVDSGAEVSCLPASIGADTYPLHGTRLSMCGGHHDAAGGGKLHELGARILGLEDW